MRSAQWLTAVAVAVAIGGCDPSERTPPPAVRATPAQQDVVEFRLAQDTPADGFVPMQVTPLETIYVRAAPDLTRADIGRASTTAVAEGRRGLIIRFTPQGAERLAQLTSANIDKRMAFLLNGRVVNAPTILEPITGGYAVIDGDFEDAELQRLTRVLSNE